MAGLGMWLRAVRDHPDPLDHAQYRALACLALRLDWVTGKGFASLTEVAADARCGVSTVQRAVIWARKRGLLERTRQGRHIGRGSSSRASEYQTAAPAQPVTCDLLPNLAAGHQGLRSRSGKASQPVTGDHPSKSYPSKSYPSKGARASAATTVRAAFPRLTDDETEQIVKTITREHKPRDPSAYVKALAASGDLARYVPCDTTAPGPHSEACRRGDGRDCGMGWCECRCHGTGLPPAEAAAGTAP
jgi:hypothetical protein